MTESESESDSYKSSNRREKPRHAGKQARVRTVLNEKQLNMLKACYQINSRPDALVKEQLVEMTRLSQRVIRVWFQNKVNFRSKLILIRKKALFCFLNVEMQR